MSSDSESEKPTLLPCPDCNQLTDSLKVFTLPVIVFFIVGAYSQRKKAAACPVCMRKRVLAMSATNVVTTHVMWPFVILPMTLIQLWITTRPGHSDDVLKLAAAQGIAVSRGSAAALRREPVPWMRRAAGVLKILIGGLLAFGASYVLCEQWFRWRGMAWFCGAIAAAAVGAACSVVVSGVANLRLTTLSWKSWGLACACAGGVFLAGAPLLARSYWSNKGAEIEAGGDLWEYMYRVPPVAWSVAGATRLVDWKVDAMAKAAETAKDIPVWDGQLAWGELKGVLDDLEEQHGNDAEFAALIAHTEETLEKYKLYGPGNSSDMLDVKTMAPSGSEMDSKPGVVSPAAPVDDSGQFDAKGPSDDKGPEVPPEPFEWDSK